MKKILLSIVTIMAVTSSGWAAETINMHDQVNNAQATAHQTMAEMHKKMLKAGPCNTPESAKSFSAMNEHEKAAIVHETVNNGQSSVIHQQQAEKHRRMNQAN